jgi:cytochrome c-type biogenesis protein CcmH/NrfG
MTTRIGVVVMAALLVLYLVLVGDRAIKFLATGEAIAIAIGVALLVLPIIGAWALLRELLFGVRAERLGRILEAEDALPADELPVRPSGRPEREAVDAIFPEYRAAVEAAPEDWRAWYRLGLAYDGAGDRRRARHAIREAIRFSAQS